MSSVAPTCRDHTNVISCANTSRPHQLTPAPLSPVTPGCRSQRALPPRQAGRQATLLLDIMRPVPTCQLKPYPPGRQTGSPTSSPTNVQHVAQVHSYCRQHEADGCRRRRPVPGPERPSQHADEAERNHGVGAAVVQPLSKARVPARERGRSVDDIYQSASVQTSEGQTHTCTDSSQGPKIGSTFRI